MTLLFTSIEYLNIPMEENGYPTTTANATSLDPALQRKHAAMLERLSDLHQSRVAGKPISDSKESFSLNTQSFLSIFSDSKLSIESRLSLIQQSQSPKSDLDSISHSISHLEELLAHNSYLLPSYELRSCLNSISSLKSSLHSVSSTLIPKQKFSFKNKSRTSKTTTSGNDVTTALPPASQGDAPIESSNKGFNSPGFKDKTNELLVKEFRNSGRAKEEVGEFVLVNLEGCEVRLIGGLRALFMHKLKHCKVYVGVVFGSVLIEEVEDCVLVMASHQIRIHNAKRCDFYLRVRSRPIIEDSDGIRFAPYCLSYGGVEKDLEEANLCEETENWANVDDFKWLRAKQSPNWSVLPEDERIGTVCISSSDGHCTNRQISNSEPPM